MSRFTLALDDPRTNLIRQQAMQQYYHSISNLQRKAPPSGCRGDLTSSMIGRVYKAKAGCGCGK